MLQGAMEAAHVYAAAVEELQASLKASDTTSPAKAQVQRLSSPSLTV